jgi:hypothetical protein
MKNLYLFGIFLLLIANSLQASKHASGVGISSYFSFKTENNLAKLFVENSEALEPYLSMAERATNHGTFDAEGKYTPGKWKKLSAFANGELKYVSCKIQIWRPLQGNTVFEENRIECSFSFENYMNGKLYFDLSDAIVSALSFSGDPSFHLDGEAVNALAAVFEKLASNKETAARYGLMKTNYQNKETILIGANGGEEPMLFCSVGSGCDLLWPKVEVRPTEISLGQNGFELLQAFCGWNAGVEGRCPIFWNDVHEVDCSFAGLTMPYETWGAVDETSSVHCRYWEQKMKYEVRKEIGPVVSKPQGGRFAPMTGVSLRGPGLRNIFFALHDYAVAHEKDDGFPISNMQLAGRAGFGFNSVSLRRAKEANNGLISVDCSEIDVGQESFYREPQKEFNSLRNSRYECKFFNQLSIRFHE